LDNMTQFRTVSFVMIFIAVALWELAAPRRRLTVSKLGRWGNNLGIILLSTLLVGLLFAAGPYAQME